MEKNITLDFTANKAMESVTANQPLAIMPAELAKKLLKDYAKRLVNTSAEDIIDAFKADINPTLDSIPDVMNKAASFIQERMLIENCAQENWDAFAVAKPLLD
jgi:hypothetical protein